MWYLLHVVRYWSLVWYNDHQRSLEVTRGRPWSSAWPAFYRWGRCSCVSSEVPYSCYRCRDACRAASWCTSPGLGKCSTACPHALSQPLAAAGLQHCLHFLFLNLFFDLLFLAASHNSFALYFSFHFLHHLNLPQRRLNSPCLHPRHRYLLHVQTLAPSDCLLSSPWLLVSAQHTLQLIWRWWCRLCRPSTGVCSVQTSRWCSSPWWSWWCTWSPSPWSGSQPRCPEVALVRPCW